MGILSQNGCENSEIQNIGRDSLYLVPDSDFDSDDEQYGDDIEEIILSNPTDNDSKEAPDNNLQIFKSNS